MEALPKPVETEDLGAALRHLENIYRLGLALEVPHVPELARRLGRTPAAIYEWVKRMGLRPRSLRDAEAVARAMEEQRRALGPYLPKIQGLLRA